MKRYRCHKIVEAARITKFIVINKRTQLCFEGGDSAIVDDALQEWRKQHDAG